MTLRYVRSGDGYIVHARERAVCSVHTKTSEMVPAHVLPNGSTAPAQVVDKHLPQSEWQFHFYHGFYTPAMLKELLDLLPKAEPDNGRDRVPVPEPEKFVAPARAPTEEERASWNALDEPFQLTPDEAEQRRRILEHHERNVRFKPATDKQLPAPKDEQAEETQSPL
jgi:hypothetical protein